METPSFSAFLRTSLLLVANRTSRVQKSVRVSLVFAFHHLMYNFHSSEQSVIETRSLVLAGMTTLASCDIVRTDLSFTLAKSYVDASKITIDDIRMESMQSKQTILQLLTSTTCSS